MDTGDNVQVRMDDGEIRNFPTLGEAARFVRDNPAAIKVSLAARFTDERIRLVRVLMPDNGWGLMFEPIAAHLLNQDGSPVLDPGELNGAWNVETG